MRRPPPVLGARPARVLEDADRRSVDGLLEATPVESVFVASRVAAHGLSHWRLGARLWGYAPHGRLTALCYSGANLMPLTHDRDAVLAFAGLARDEGRICSSIVGPTTAALALWAELASEWDTPREVRPCQPLLAVDREPPVRPHPGVRRARMTDFDALLPACVAMYTEEVGVSPLTPDGGATYRARVAELVRWGRSFILVKDGAVVFKAEVGAASRRACQIQGVWVRPELRGQGLAATGMAAVVSYALRAIAPVVSLYVNEYNHAARAVYARCGFVRVGTFATVMF